MKRVLFFISTVFFSSIACGHKIIGLMPVRNEASTVGQALKALSLFVDAIVVLDDASDDGTTEAIKSIAEECKVEKLIEKKEWYRDEPGDANLMLQEGRKLGGTHFIRLDADEMFTSNCLDDDWLRSKILELQPGDKYSMSWIQLWRSPNQYRFDSSVWSSCSGDFIFCDDGKCFYESKFIHTTRSPQNLGGRLIYLSKHAPLYFRDLLNDRLILSKFLRGGLGIDGIERFVMDKFSNLLENGDTDSIVKTLRKASNNPAMLNPYKNDFTVGVMHFQFVNWDCLLYKQAWYRCLEKIRDTDSDVKRLNEIYGQSKNEKNLKLRPAPDYWLSGYIGFYNPTDFLEKKSWHKQQVLAWFNQYGRDFFGDLDIWDVNWS